MRWKKIGKALLFPPAAVPALLLPVGTVLLVWAMLTREETDGIRIASYVFAFYTLVVCCARLPELVRTVRRVRRENRYVRRWLEDARLRTNATLSANVVWNGAYAALQLMLGIRHQSAWFYSLAGYYASLAVMRLFLVQHTMRHTPGERLRQELTRYRACGRIFLFMNLALSVMMLCRIRQNPAVQHDAVITIAMAAYTFTTLTAAIVQMLRYRRYQSPAMSAAKAISLAAACVSMLSLESTMLASFGTDSMTPQVQRLFLALSGGAVSVLIVVMAVYMIAQANRKLKLLGEQSNGE